MCMPYDTFFNYMIIHLFLPKNCGFFGAQGMKPVGNESQLSSKDTSL